MDPLIHLSKEYGIDRSEVETLCRYSNSRAPGGFAAYNIQISPVWYRVYLNLTCVSIYMPDNSLLFKRSLNSGPSDNHTISTI